MVDRRSAPSPQPADDTLMAILVRRRSTIGLCMILGLVVGMAYWVMWPPRYTAVGTFTVERDATYVTGENGDNTDSTEFGRFLQTQAEITRSLPVIGIAVENLRSGSLPPEQWVFFTGERNLISHLQTAIDTKVRQDSAVIEVELTARDAVEAETIVQRVIDAYSSYTEQQRATRGRSAMALLEEQYDKKKVELADVRQQILDVQQRAGMTGFDNDGGSLQMRQLQTLQKALIEAELARYDAEQQYDDLLTSFQAEASRNGIPLSTSSISLSDEAEQDVRRDLRLTQQRLNDLLETYLPSHPTVQRIRQQELKLKGDLVAINRSKRDNALRREERLRQQVEDAEATGGTMNADASELANYQADAERLEQLLDQLNERMLTAALKESSGSLIVTPIDPANVDRQNVTPKLSTSLAGSLALGLLAGVLLGLLQEAGSPRLPAGEKRLTEAMALPVIGMLPAVDGASRRRLVLAPVQEPGLDYAAAAIDVADAVLATPGCEDVGTLLVTAPMIRQGRSTAAATLAVSLAALGKNVLLLDANLGSPAVHGIFGKSNDTGLANVLRGEMDLNHAIQDCEAPGLSLLPAGDLANNAPGDLLNSANFDQVLSDLRRAYDIVVLDAPAESEGDAARVAASACDATLLVIRGAAIDRRRAEAARDRLLDVGANVAGMIVNNSAAGQPRLAEDYGDGPVSVAASA